MTADDDVERLRGLVLALVAKRISMDYLVGAGFTPGQVMRELLETQAVGLVSQQEGRTTLTEVGLQKLDQKRIGDIKDRWIRPLDEERIPVVSIDYVWLPEDSDSFD